MREVLSEAHRVRPDEAHVGQTFALTPNLLVWVLISSSQTGLDLRRELLVRQLGLAVEDHLKLDGNVMCEQGRCQVCCGSDGSLSDESMTAATIHVVHGTHQLLVILCTKYRGKSRASVDKLRLGGCGLHRSVPLVDDLAGVRVLGKVSNTRVRCVVLREGRERLRGRSVLAFLHLKNLDRDGAVRGLDLRDNFCCVL
jgi:hypothetical protein